MPSEFFKTKLKITISSLTVAVVLFLAIILGINNGIKQAQSEVVLKTQSELLSGLQFFYNDQNRYPTVLEYEDKSVMLNYFTNFPPIDFISKTCASSFVYKRDDSQNFVLNFCLPDDSGSYTKGWHMVLPSK